MTTIDPRKILTRHPANPILKPEDFHGINTVFNPSPAMYQGKTVLLVSCTTFAEDVKNCRETRVAMSDDGLNFSLADEPLVKQAELPYPFSDLGGIIDCRLTQIGDDYYFLSPQGTWEIGFSGVCMVMYKTKDFKTAELVDIAALPNNRGASIFPEKINGMYWKLDRPGGVEDPGSIWISQSPDLIHWGQFRPILAPGYSIWNTKKIGPTPPIKVPEGWLVIVHGVDEPCDGTHYYIGAMLLDSDNPRKLIGKTQSWILQPETDLETRGKVDNVVFPCGALADLAKDELRLFYGAADTRICLATGSIKELVEACLDPKA